MRKNIAVDEPTKARFDSFQRKLAVKLDRKMTATDTVNWLIDMVDPESNFAVYDSDKEKKGAEEE